MAAVTAALSKVSVGGGDSRGWSDAVARKSSGTSFVHELVRRWNSIGSSSVAELSSLGM